MSTFVSEGAPILLQTLATFEGQGLAAPQPLGLSYTVPKARTAGMFYFRAGSTVGGMVNISVMRDGALMRYFPVAPNSAIHTQELERRRRVELAQARMVARLARPPSLSQIAGDLNVSPRQLQRDFRAITGLTPMQYLNVVRMSEANSLLAETSMPIRQIAELLGYVSQAHFSAQDSRMSACMCRLVARTPTRSSSWPTWPSCMAVARSA